VIAAGGAAEGAAGEAAGVEEAVGGAAGDQEAGGGDQEEGTMATASVAGITLDP
jgi:hypothetical protein